MKKIISYILLMLAVSPWSMAQALKGRVISAADQRAIPSAAVKIKNTNTGVAADSSGNFSIILPPGKSTLHVSSVGYLARDVEVYSGFTAEVVIELQLAANILNEVVVSTGFQELSAERATGSFAKVDNEMLNRRVSTDILSRLENVVPGMVFNKGRGGTEGIRIRGQSTIFAEASPLIVLDNFPFEGDINTINPSDIESITVLKDAAAASIWGARSGNGVIVITTKKGKFYQENQVSFNSSVNVTEKPDAFYIPEMSPGDFIENERKLFDKGFYTARELSPYGLSLTPAVELLIAKRDGILSATEAENQINALKTHDVRNDFEKYLYRRSVAQQYNIGLNGGSAKHSYTFSSGYDKNLLNLTGNDYSRVTANLQNSFSLLKDRVRLSAGIHYTSSINNLNNTGPGSINMTPVTGLYPYARLADDEGNPLMLVRDYSLEVLTKAENEGLLNWQYKPLEEPNHTHHASRNTSYRFTTALTADILKGLNAEVRYQYFGSHIETRNLRDEESYFTRDLINQLSQVNADGSIIRPIPLGGILDQDHENIQSHNFRAQLNYRNNWLGVHDLSVMAGSEVQDRVLNAYESRVYGFDEVHATSNPVDYISAFHSYINPGSTRPIENRNSRRELTDRFLSYYLNAGYTYQSKYTLSLSGRIDKSNLFGVKTNQKGVGLGSGGLAWNISKEPFYKADWLPFLKIRISYGYNGNVDKRTTAYTTARYNAGNLTPTRLPYATVSNPPNPQLRWEKIRIINGGLDFESRKGTISGSMDVFRKTGIDLIGSTPFPASSGITSFRGNASNTSGKGIDVVLNTLNIDKRLKWSSTFIFNYIDDKVTEYAVDASKSSYVQFSDGLGTYPYAGKPVYALYSYPWVGLDPQTGELLGYLDGNLSKDYAQIMSAIGLEDIIYNGPARPVYSGALRNNLRIGNFALSATVVFKTGHFFRRPSVIYSELLNGRQSHGDFALRWQKPGDELHTIVPAYPETINGNRDNLYSYSEALVEKADHIRLQDVNLSYDIGTVLKKSGIRNGQLFLHADNMGILWKATKSGMDPDYLSSAASRSIAAGFRVNF